MADFSSCKEELGELVSKFEQDKNHYLRKGCPEVQVRIGSLNPFFDALGWGIENKAHKPPHERDVIVELSPETSLRPDYNFRINGNRKFFIEASIRMIDFNNPNMPSTISSSRWWTGCPSFIGRSRPSSVRRTRKDRTRDRRDG